MKVELTLDENASRAMHMPVMDFHVTLDNGEKRTRALTATMATLAFQAASAWDCVHEPTWRGTAQ
jgi:hypothetical protein